MIPLDLIFQSYLQVVPIDFFYLVMAFIFVFEMVFTIIDYWL